MSSFSIFILVNKSKIQSLTAQFLSIYSLLFVPPAGLSPVPLVLLETIRPV